MATSTEAVMVELEKEGLKWVRSEQFQKQQKLLEKERQKNNPMKQCVLKFDHFENIHRLPKEIPAIEGSPNFRQVPGYLVFGTGQPTQDGFRESLKHIFQDLDAKRVLWTNMRQEPVVYMNGQSFTPRLREKMNENMEFPDLSGDDIEWLQDAFVSTILERRQEDMNSHRIKKEDKGKVCYYRDTYAEHPEDRENIEYKVFLEKDEHGEEALVTLSGMYDKLKRENPDWQLSYARLPIVDEKAPREVDFDTILDELRKEDKDTACVFNCQMGKGRTTTGMILACLVKDVLFGEKCRAYTPLPPVNPKDFEEEEDAFNENAKRGHFEVLEKIFQYVPEAKDAKAHLDHVIDLCGEPPLGTGLQNLRECIIWTKQKFDFEPKMKKPFWRQMSINFIERYCYLILFATYLRTEVANGFERSFVLWMDIRAEIREIVYQGGQNFEWK